MKLLKRLHFSKKYRQNLHKMWDMEFVLHGSRETREGFRMEYDRMMEKLNGLRKVLKQQKKKKADSNTLKALRKSITETKTDIEQLKGQMDKIDNEIKIVKGGVDNHKAILDMVKKYKKNL